MVEQAPSPLGVLAAQRAQARRSLLECGVGFVCLSGKAIGAAQNHQVVQLEQFRAKRQSPPLAFGGPGASHCNNGIATPDRDLTAALETKNSVQRELAVRRKLVQALPDEHLRPRYVALASRCLGQRAGRARTGGWLWKRASQCVRFLQ